jgi:cytochrome c oxidase subunit 2
VRIAAALLACAAALLAVVAIAGGEEEGATPARTATPAGTANAAAPARGLAVWTAQGCGSCHKFAAAGASGEIGPDLGASLRGMPADYIRESIVAPARAAAPGYATGMMPEDYARRIAPADLHALVEFIRSRTRD